MQRNSPSKASAALLALMLSLGLLALASGCKPQNGTTSPPPASSRVDYTPDPAEKGKPTISMKIGSETFALEVAYSEPDQERGLMARRSMSANHGMIFVNTDEITRHFWMKNTLIPLDIVFLDRGGKVVSVKQMKPMDLSDTSSEGPAMYAIELNKGDAARVGVKAGDMLDLPKEVRVP
jgi:uncharacterized membrane protein (UPF0127 family)